MIKLGMKVFNTNETLHFNLNEVLTVLNADGTESDKMLLGETKASISRGDNKTFVFYLIKEKGEKLLLRYSASLGNQIIFELEDELTTNSKTLKNE